MSTKRRVRVNVEPRLCEGHGLCLQLAPEVFDIADDEIAFCVEEHANLHHLEDITAAVAACPRQAITSTSTDEHHDVAEDSQ